MNVIFLIFFIVLIYYLVKSRSNKKSQSQSLSPYETKLDHQMPPKKDAWGGNFWDTTNQIDVRAVLRIDYIDAENQRTIRDIEVVKVGDIGNDKMIMAHCRLRNSTRTFLLSRIQHCADLDTGEVVSDIYEHLRKIFVRSPAYFANRLVEEHSDFLKILLFVAKADGAFRKKEKEVFIAVCNNLVATDLIDENVVNKLVEVIQVPSLGSFRLAVGRLAKEEVEIQRALVAAAKSIGDTKKEVSAAERDAMEYLEKKLLA